MPVPTRSFQPLTIVTYHRPPQLGLGMARQTRWHLSGVDRLSSIRPSSQPLRGTESSTQISRDVFSLRGTNMAKTGMTCSDASSYDLIGHHGMRQCLGVALRREKPGPGPGPGPAAEINEQPAGRTHYARLRSGGPAVRRSVGPHLMRSLCKHSVSVSPVVCSQHWHGPNAPCSSLRPLQVHSVLRRVAMKRSTGLTNHPCIHACTFFAFSTTRADAPRR